MFEAYCRTTHHTRGGVLCEDCQTLLNYALSWLERCSFQENKPTCLKCQVHCYQKNTTRKSAP